MFRANALARAAIAGQIALSDYIHDTFRVLGGLNISESPQMLQSYDNTNRAVSPLREFAENYFWEFRDVCRSSRIPYDRWCPGNGCNNEYNRQIISPWMGAIPPDRHATDSQGYAAAVDAVTIPAWDIEGTVLQAPLPPEPFPALLGTPKRFMYALPPLRVPYRHNYVIDTYNVRVTSERARAVAGNFALHSMGMPCGFEAFPLLSLHSTTEIAEAIRPRISAAEKIQVHANTRTPDFTAAVAAVPTVGHYLYFSYSIAQLRLRMVHRHINREQYRGMFQNYCRFLCQQLNLAVRNAASHNVSRASWRFHTTRLRTATDVAQSTVSTEQTPTTLTNHLTTYRANRRRVSRDRASENLDSAKETLVDTQQEIKTLEEEVEAYETITPTSYPVQIAAALEAGVIESARITEEYILAKLAPFRQKLHAVRCRYPAGVYEHRDVWVVIDTTNRGYLIPPHRRVQILQPNGAVYPHPHVLAGDALGHPCMGETTEFAEANRRLWDMALLNDLTTLYKLIGTYLTQRYESTSYRHLQTVAWQITDGKGKAINPPRRFHRAQNNQFDEYETPNAQGA